MPICCRWPLPDRQQPGTNEKSIELETLLTKDEFSKLMEFIGKQEIKAFITAGNVSEVYGLWFKDKKAVKERAEQR